ncbi:hypothetical protein [Agrobacterium vitis]|uniref:hypothetical protein n=1 Tax=Agrobacterium vitis TaxID=373 RepID=UPI003D292DE0
MNSSSQAHFQDIFISPFLETIDKRKLKIRLRKDHAPLIAGYGLLHRRMNRAMTLALDAVDKYETARRDEGFSDSIGGQPYFAADAFTDAVYRAAELFEFYDSDIVDYLEPSLNPDIKKIYKKNLKKITGHLERLCNGCKHNHAFLVPVEGQYNDGAWLSGYSYYRHEGDKMIIDRGIHQFSDAFSYNWAFRKLIATILQADIEATMLVKALPDDSTADAIDSNLFPLPYSHAFPRISSRSLDAFPGEEKSSVPNFSISKDGGQEMRLANAPPLVRATECKLRCVIEFTTATMVVQQPYSENVVNIALNRQGGAERLPIGGFLRFIMNGISVPSIKKDGMEE